MNSNVQRRMAQLESRAQELGLDSDAETRQKAEEAAKQLVEYLYGKYGGEVVDAIFCEDSDGDRFIQFLREKGEDELVHLYEK